MNRNTVHTIAIDAKALQINIDKQNSGNWVS
jgi:hypothetical protein